MESQYIINRRAIALGLKPPPEKKEAKPIAKVSEKKKQQMKDEKPQAELLEEFFIEAVKKHPGKCQNCGCKIDTKIFVYAKMTVAHILAKRKSMFPSVATHKENYLYLCVTNGCHNKFDTSWEDAAKMKIWPEAVRKFLLIYPWIASNEKRNLPDVLLENIEPI